MFTDLTRHKVKEVAESIVATRVGAVPPSDFLFHPNGQILYFLARRPEKAQNSLYFLDLPSSLPSSRAAWKELIDEEEVLKSRREMSREEELLRERMRATAFGITSYTFHAPSRQFLIPAGGTLYTLDVSKHTPEQKEISLKEIGSGEGGARMDAKQNPNDPAIVSFVRNGDLWLTHTPTGTEKRLTFSRKDPADNKISSGVAEFIIQEEFDRYTGYWWQKLSEREKAANPLMCRLLYLEVDESQVEIYNIPEAADIEGKNETFRYPLAGGKNAVSRVCIAEFDASNFGAGQSRVLRLNPSVEEAYPWSEYIVRCGWVPPDNDQEPRVWLQLLDRKQQRLQLLTFGLSQFVSESQSQSESPSQSQSQSSESGSAPGKVLVEDTSDIWINVTNLVHFFEDGSGRVIWGSEIPTGYRHLYLLDPKTHERRAITEGEFVVEDALLQVDEANGRVYFLANQDTPLETHLYVASFTSPHPSPIHRLTEGGYMHSGVALSHNFDAFVTVYSNLKTFYQGSVFRVNWVKGGDGGQEVPHVAKLLDIEIPQAVKQPIFPALPPEPFSFTNSTGEKAHGVFFRPTNFEEGRRYPTILYVYGGPHVQLVVNSYSLTQMHKRWQALASLGCLVVIIDGIGSWKRGLKWEGHLRLRMGQVEVADQVLGLEHLMSEYKFIDPTRIAVTGWSYGGYLSLAFLAQRPDFFKLAIAGGPVTLWEAYDTGYTERYMDTPENNQEGYSKGSVLNMIHGFPDEENRLFIIHGLIDENVHFCNTAKLIDSLIVAGKPYQLQVFPSERHGVRSPATSRYWESTFLSIIKNHL